MLLVFSQIYTLPQLSLGLTIDSESLVVFSAERCIMCLLFYWHEPQVLYTTCILYVLHIWPENVFMTHQTHNVTIWPMQFIIVSGRRAPQDSGAIFSQPVVKSPLPAVGCDLWHLRSLERCWVSIKTLFLSEFLYRESSTYPRDQLLR